MAGFFVINSDLLILYNGYTLYGVDILNGNIIITGTITYALRGRDLLRRQNFRASVERNLTLNKRYGCGYGIAVYGDINEALKILEAHNVKVIDTAPIM